MVLQNIFLLDRPEGSQSHMERHVGDIHAFLRNLLQQLRGEMQSGSRRRRRSLVLRIDRLITVLVLQFMCDIRWKRHLPESVQHLFKNPFVEEADQPVSLFHHIQHFRFETSVSKSQSRSRFRFLSRLHQRFPDVLLSPFQKQDFDRCAGVLFYSHQPCRDHLGIVQHQTIPRS